MVMGAKSNDSVRALFANYSRGVMTNRDAWAYNAGQAKVQANMTRMIGFYNAEVQRFNAAHPGLDTKARAESPRFLRRLFGLSQPTPTVA